MNQTYDKTFVASPRRFKENETYVKRPNNQTYNTTPRRNNPNRTYDLPAKSNRTYNKSSGRERNKTYEVEEDSDESSSFDFVQEDDYSPESTTPPFLSSDSSLNIQSYSKFGKSAQRSTPKPKLNLLEEFDGLNPIMKRLEERLEKSTRTTQLGQTFTKSPKDKFSTPSNRTWAIFVDDMETEHRKRSKSTPRRPTPAPQYYATTPTRASPSNMTSRNQKMVSRKLDFSNPVENQLHFTNRMSVTRTDENGCSVTFTRSKSGPDVSVLKNRDC